MYWAAACVAFWAGGATDGQKVQAIDMICDDAKLTVPQEVLLKQLFQKLTKEEKEELWHH